MVATFLDIDQVNERVDQLLRELGTLGLSWRPHLSGHRNTHLSEQILKRGAHGIAVSDLNTAGSVATIASSILVTVPPALSDIDFVPFLPRMTDSILAVDHFVQAEKISVMAQHLGISQSVVIEIETGCGRTGVRPGNDALALAEGIERLPSVQVVGLTTQNTDRDVSDGALSALQETKDRLDRLGVDCSLVSASGVPAATGFGCLTESRTVDVLCSKPGCKNPVIWIVAEVVSRPALDRAVLYHGRRFSPADDSAWLPDFPSAAISQRLPDHCVVSQISESAGLQIGDEIRIAVEHPDQILFFHDNRIRAITR